MQRSILIRLRNVPVIPSGLRTLPATNAPADQAFVDLGRLYHHYYFDGYGVESPSPDPTSFEYVNILSTEHADFRFRAFVADASTTRKKAISTELGQAFCRWILHEHFGLVYFAHMRDVLDKPTHAAFDGLTIRRVGPGDTPDYLCARKVDQPCIAEAKGRFSAISFDNSEFRDWRLQVGRIRVTDKRGMPLRLKTYIVGTRLVTAESRDSTRAAVYLEDPTTVGERDYSPEEDSGLKRGAIAVHYGRILSRLDLPLLSAALMNGFVIPAELQFQLVVWECLIPPLAGRRFIGGYVLRDGGRRPTLSERGWVHDNLEISGRSAPFVGLELEVARGLSVAARNNWARLLELPVLEFGEQRPSQLTWLADGTVSGPVEFFRPVEMVAL